MKKIALIFLLFIKIITLEAQSFQGTILYEFQNEWVSDELKDLQLKTLGYSIYDGLNGKMTIFQIDGSYLLQVSIKKDSSMYDIIIQSPHDAYFAYEKGEKAQSYEAHPRFKLEEADRKEKTNEKKYILGIACQKYIYVFTNQKTNVELWLADSFSFDKKNQTQKFFSDIFQKEGLVMEYRLVAYNAINVLRVKEISIHAHDVPLTEQIKALNVQKE